MHMLGLSKEPYMLDLDDQKGYCHHADCAISNSKLRDIAWNVR